MTADTGKRTWKIAWTYKLDQYGANIVPNMVSLAAADYDKDGIDDLAVSWGYCGPESNQPSHAVIMMGADNNQIDVYKRQPGAFPSCPRRGGPSPNPRILPSSTPGGSPSTNASPTAPSPMTVPCKTL